MKQIKLTFLLTVLISMVGARATAHDFAVVNADGVTIYYEKTSATEVAVSYRGTGPNSYNNEYTGAVVIPSSVIYSGTTYSVTSIGNSAFYNCTGLTSVTIPNSVKSINSAAFSGCSGLTAITMTYSVTSIESYAFRNCSSLTSISLPGSVTSIGPSAFESCSNLISIDIPNSVRSIDYRAFYGTAWYDNQPDGLVYAGKVAYAYKGTMPENTSIDIEEGTKSITALAFAGCNGLKSITIPLGIASIEQGTFMGCRSLTSISIPNSVTSIDNQAFLWCESLTNITIPNNVMTMGNSVFSNCTSLTSIYVPFDKLAEWANGPLSDNKAQLAVKLTANAAGPANYSTYYYGATTSLKPNLVADENTTVYKAKQKDASTLTLTTIDDRIIPDATAVVLKTTDDEIVLRYTETAATGDFTDNILEGSNTYKEVDPDTYYVLGQNAGNIGFYVFTGHVLAAGKAYIPVSSVSGMAARGLTLEEDGETTGIDNFAPTLPQGEEAVYDLQGRRVEHPVKGIYIVNGRKVVIR